MSEILSEQAAQEALFTAMQQDGKAPESYGLEGGGAAAPDDAAEQALAAQREASTPTTEDNSQGETETTTQTAEEAATEAFTRLDPNTIPEDLKPWYQSMQADYTRKTQQIAEQRKNLEALGDIESAQNALTFYNSLQDPNFAKNFYGQLGDTLTNLGYLEAQAQAAQELQTPVAPVVPASYQDQDEYFAAKAQELEAKYQAIEDRLTAQQQAAEQAQAYAALAGEIQRQESIIRDSNPHYTDSDLEAIHAIAGQDRTLLEAQDVYEAAVADRLNRMMVTKTAVSTTHGTPAPTGGAVEAPDFGGNLDKAHAAAMEKLRQILAADQ